MIHKNCELVVFWDEANILQDLTDDWMEILVVNH